MYQCGIACTLSACGNITCTLTYSAVPPSAHSISDIHASSFPHREHVIPSLTFLDPDMKS